MKVTIRHVAEKAKVHPSTVSRVFSGNARISEATRQRVIAAADQLNFHPNAIVRSLTTRRAHTLGMVIPYTQQEFFLDSFFPEGAHRAVGQRADSTCEKALALPIDCARFDRAAAQWPISLTRPIFGAKIVSHPGRRLSDGERRYNRQNDDKVHLSVS